MFKESKGLRKTKEWTLISDVFKGQWTDSVKQLVSDNNGEMVRESNDMTHKFQPLDLIVNRSCKAFMRKESQNRHANQVQAQITNCVEPEKVAIIFCSMTHYHSIDSENNFLFLQSLFFPSVLSLIVSAKCANLKLSEYITFWVREFKAERKLALCEF